MVVLQYLIQFLFIIIIQIGLSPVQSVNYKLLKIDSSLPSRELLEKIIDKQLEQIDTKGTLHIIIDLKVDNIILNSLLMKYMRNRVCYLWNNQELIPERVASCEIVRNVVGIYADISHVRPLEQRGFFSIKWRPRSKFSVWITDRTILETVQTVLENFWSLDCLDVEVIIAHSKYSGIRRFTYNPFINGPHSRGKLIRLPPFHEFFMDKMKNLYGYNIPISLYHAVPDSNLADYTTLKGASGVHVEALRYLSSWLNFTIVLKSSPLPLSSYTQHLPHETYNITLIGPVGDIIKERSDVLGNPQLVEIAADLNLDFIYPLRNVELQIVVPIDNEISSFARIFRYTDTVAEIAVFISVGLFSMYVAIVYKRNMLLTFFQLLFQNSIYLDNHQMSQRILLFSWLIFSNIIASLHNSYIVKSLTDRTISQSITTSLKVASSDLKIILDYTHFKALKHLDEYTKNKLFYRIEINPNFDECILRLGKGERVACVGTSPIVKSGLDTLKKYLIGNKQKIIQHPYIIKTQKYRLSALIVRKGFPFLMKFKKGYFNMYRFGLYQKWRTDEHVGYFKVSREFEGALKLSHFQSVFRLFATCITIASVTFFCEIIFYHIKTKIRM